MKRELENVKEMSDNDLESWYDAITVARVIEDDGVEDRVDYLRGLNMEAQVGIGLMIEDEVDRRADNRNKVLVAHTLEQTEAMVEANRPLINNQLLQARCARLLRLLSLNAPQVILDHAHRLVAKTAPT